MGFDAFMLRAVANELNEKISGCRVEKILQPSKDELSLLLHRDGKHVRLQINAGAAAARIGITEESPENPKVPPNFCMLARKHLTGAKIESISQLGFERVIEILFETYDEMGFLTKRRLICEIMGRYSNAVLCDKDYKILNALRPVDFTTSRKRQLLPQMLYEMPPRQDKKDPLTETQEGFISSVGEISDGELVRVYAGISPLTAREIVFRAGEGADKAKLWESFSETVRLALENRYTPTLILNEKGEPFDFSPFDVKQYGGVYGTKTFASLGELTDGFFAERERQNRERQRAHDTERLLKNIEQRLVKKLELQGKELADTEKKSEYKLKADAITANIYRLKNHVESATLTAFIEDGDGNYTETEVTVKFERGLTPSQYAQKLYKRYNKAKNAEREITAQIEKGQSELTYIRSVQYALSRINGQEELLEIQSELSAAGYGKKETRDIKKQGKKNYVQKEKQLRSPLKFTTSGGFTVLVGKNNLQNDHLTFRLALKNDLWFHVKNVPGSHTVLLCEGREPSEKDVTEAAILAAKNSKACGEPRINVDYTRVKNVKKPSGAKPGFVIYESYSTAIVSAE